MRIEWTADAIKDFRALFSSNLGKNVLKMLLWDMGFFTESSTEEQVAMKNYATRLVSMLGGNDPTEAIPSFVDVLLKLPIVGIDYEEE